MAKAVNTRGDAPIYFLVDNGSLRPEATLNLRSIARDLSVRTDVLVHPVSLLHSHKISSGLDGIPAQILVPTMRAYARKGFFNIVIVPLFFGASRALTDYIPQQVRRLKVHFPQLSVSMAPTLVSMEAHADQFMVNMLKRQIDAVVSAHQLVRPKVIMVDHGTPAKPVNAVRNYLGKQLVGMLEGMDFSVASMERREGEEYAFNEPLLERLLATEPFSRGPIVLSMLFLSPGRHAGTGGDIDEICASAQARSHDLRCYKTKLVGELPEIVDILARNMEHTSTKLV